MMNESEDQKEQAIEKLREIIQSAESDGLYIRLCIY